MGQAGETTSENGNSLAGPGRRRLGLESHRPGRAWARDLKISPAGPGAGCARRRRLGPARSNLRESAPPAKTVGLKILDFLEFVIKFGNTTKRDISAVFVRNRMS